MKIQDFVNAKEISLFIKNLPPEVTIDEALFPSTKQMGMELEQAKGAKQRPVALKMSTFDVAVKPRALKAELNIEKKEMPFFKESVLIKEKDRQQLLLAMAANNQNLVDQILSQVFNNYKVLVEGAKVQRRRMNAQLIQKGEINITTVDGDIVVTYGVPENHKEELKGGATWDNPTANIVGDIERWQGVIVNEGYARPDRMILTAKTFGYICDNTAIIDEIKGKENPIVTRNMVQEYLKNKLNIQVAIVNGVFIAEDGKTMNYYEDDVVSLIPQGTLGRTVFGTTPEEADTMFGASKLDTQIVETGVAITTMLKEDPVTVETKVSQLTLPSFERADECFFATVKPATKSKK
ncbi:MAG: major capsid protein [Paraclostridium sp.]